MQLKYVMMDNTSSFGNLEGFYIFPGWIEHKDVAKDNGGKEHVIGAGFLTLEILNNGKLVAHCYGYSESLGIGVGDMDNRLITRFLQQAE